MVHKRAQRKTPAPVVAAATAPKVRGRPRAYDPDQALVNAMSAFWRLGYSGASVDQLSDATDMNRPSMYAAFGDKRSLYLKTLERYILVANQVTEKTLDVDVSLPDALRRFYDAALASYLPAGDSPRGCYLIGTAATEAVMDEEVRTTLITALRGFERALEKRIRYAKKQGELPASADPAALAVIAAAILHTLAVRARAGESRATLKSISQTGIDFICG